MSRMGAFGSVAITAATVIVLQKYAPLEKTPVAKYADFIELGIGAAGLGILGGEAAGAMRFIGKNVAAGAFISGSMKVLGRVLG